MRDEGHVDVAMKIGSGGMKRRTLMYSTTTLGLAVLLASASVWAEDRFELSDTELNRVTAGTATVYLSGDLVKFSASKTTASGRYISIEGTLELVENINNHVTGTLILSDAAQNNLQSLININAVNSQINVLLNLVVNIDSVVGEVHQHNLTWPLPDLIGP